MSFFEKMGRLLISRGKIKENSFAGEESGRGVAAADGGCDPGSDPSCRRYITKEFRFCTVDAPLALRASAGSFAWLAPTIGGGWDHLTILVESKRMALTLPGWRLGYNDE